MLLDRGADLAANSNVRRPARAAARAALSRLLSARRGAAAFSVRTVLCRARLRCVAACSHESGRVETRSRYAARRIRENGTAFLAFADTSTRAMPHRNRRSLAGRRCTGQPNKASSRSHVCCWTVTQP